MRTVRAIVPFAALLLASCTAFVEPEFARLADQPLATEPAVRSVTPWSFEDHSGTLIRTAHFQIYSTVDDPVMEHLLVRVLESARERNAGVSHFQWDQPLDCYVFSSRNQWASYTRQRAGESATIYLQIASGGYCRQGVFAGYDIGRDRTLSVIAHEAWHQYSWYAFKSRLPSWLEEGLATQNEAMVWDGGMPTFVPEKNTPRLAALRQAVRGTVGGGGGLFKLEDLLSTHAGRVIGLSQSRVDTYYAQLWSLTLFLQTSPVYGPRLQRLLNDAAAGTLVNALAGTSVTPQEIADYSEHWNAVAGPVYMEKYLCGDLDALDHDYQVWLHEFLRNN